MPFRLEPSANAPFDRRLVIEAAFRDRWLVLTYRGGSETAPVRPLLRLHRAGGATQDMVLPGVVLGAAHWLGYLPPDLEEIELCADPDLVIERVGLRGHGGVLVQALLRRPDRAAAALWYRLKGNERRFRDSLRGACAVTPLHRWSAWKRERLRALPPPTPPTRVGLVLPVLPGQEALLGRTVASLLAQDHGDWSLRILWAASAGTVPLRSGDPRIAHAPWDDTIPLAEAFPKGEAAGLLLPGACLTPDALARLAAALPPDLALAYADEEVGGVPRLKPDWSPDLARATAYPGEPMLVSAALLARIGDAPAGAFAGFSERFAFAVCCAAESGVHLPRLLRQGPERPPSSAAERARYLEAALAAQGSAALPRIVGNGLDLQWPVPDPLPLVSVIIPSKDRPELIGKAVEGVLKATDYPAIELIVVDNDSTDPAVLRFYEGLQADPRVRIESYPRPFNFSAMVNRGAGVAQGKILLLLNNDVAVLSPGWLTEMVRQACRPEVGAVGAMLFYGDGRIQHAGVVVGLGGEAGHILRRRPGDTSGHIGRLLVAHEVSAVTAACLAISARKYRAIGGFDEDAFAVDFNDVDFCLRLGAAGWKTVWTPHAVLAHLESVSRGSPRGEARTRFEREAATFAARWRDTIRHDPFYHPALSLTTFGEALE